jgi:hypothetical protein
VELQLADIAPDYILGACAAFVTIAGPPFLLGMAGRHRAAITGILIPGAIVFIVLGTYLGRPAAHTGLLIALAAAASAFLGWGSGAALWQWRRVRSEREESAGPFGPTNQT